MNLKYSDKNLRKLINEAIDRLAPLFELGSKQIGPARTFGIIRDLSGPIYGPLNGRYPQYSFLDNLFFFPKKDYLCAPKIRNYFPQFSDEEYFEICGLTSDSMINHETSHRLHNLINPEQRRLTIKSLRTDKVFEHLTDLREMVAEWGNMILTKRNYKRTLGGCSYEYELRAFSKYGPKFLPRLARMPLQKAIEIGLFKYLNI